MRRLAVQLLVFLAVLAVVGWLFWRHYREQAASQQLVLYGNVDLRQVDLAFNNNERIAAVLVEEGNRVRRGQVLARLDTSRLDPQVAQAAGQVAAQQQAVDRLHNGSRPEEIAQARANVKSAEADAVNALRHYDRLKRLSATGAASQQDFDDSKAALDVAKAKVDVSQKSLDLAEIGPRQEDVAQGEAQLRSNQAQLAFLKQQLADAELLAPTDAIVRSRLLEPGDMASPQKPAFSLAVIDPKWVRAYVSEPDLGKVHPGMIATVSADSFPGRRFEGWVGFISPMAEFTPKTVQTDELRTSLVYEVRVFVKDPSDDLRLGMPASVYLPLDQHISVTDKASSAAEPASPAAIPKPPAAAPTSPAAPAS
jgi:HlyD family secretion protein